MKNFAPIVFATHASQKKTELQLIKKEKELLEGYKKFLSIIAHDIKTPMGAVISFINLIQVNMNEWSKEEIEEKLQIALTSAENTYSLLNSLLEWANSNNIFKSFNPENINFNILLDEEIASIQLSASQKNIDLFSPEAEKQNVYSDKNMVKSILRNLLSNAIKYSHNSGNIEVSTAKTGQFLEVTIKDYGVGIQADTVNELFSTSNYISTLGTDNEPGTGYGLLLCKELIEMNKGKIWVVGNADKGSEFKFTLPLSKPHARPL